MAMVERYSSNEPLWLLQEGHRKDHWKSRGEDVAWWWLTRGVGTQVGLGGGALGSMTPGSWHLNDAGGLLLARESTVRLERVSPTVQGYLAHKKPTPNGTLQQRYT
jgi:hypothetical protein